MIGLTGDLIRMIRIFSYGSLLDENSLKETVPDAYNLFPARLYGYQRIFDLIAKWRFDEQTGKPICILNVKKTDDSQGMNGMCFDMSEVAFEALLLREKGYDLVETVVESYVDPDEKHQARFFMASNYESYPYSLDSKIQQKYLNHCISGCQKYGKGFLDDFIKSTEFYGIKVEDYHNKIWNNVI